MASPTAHLPTLSDKPTHFPHCCPAVSAPLIDRVAVLLPEDPALVLSVGCGGGLLEALLLARGEHTDGPHTRRLNIVGVEVPACPVRHLHRERVVRVSSTTRVCSDAVLASVVVFVYPRQPKLIESYVEAGAKGVLEKVVWLGHRSDWPDAEAVFAKVDLGVEVLEGCGIAEYEVLAVATLR